MKKNYFHMNNINTSKQKNLDILRLIYILRRHKVLHAIILSSFLLTII